jgi:lipopolysaccharide/colanic/teichoic acid biosynthesis glycosyltransferase
LPEGAPIGGRRKRALDLVIALPLTIALTPLMIAIAVMVRRDSPGPAFFRQERVGYDGRAFTLLKFRTMVVGAQEMEGGLAVSDGDSRITHLGATLRRLSLDELPQLWNIVRGDMSLVGPRPTVASQVELYDARQRGRLRARPGLTGLAQVTGRNAIPWSERIEIDLSYIERWRLRRDLAILVRTAFVVLRGEGTYKGPRGGFDLPPPGAPDG